MGVSFVDISGIGIISTYVYKMTQYLPRKTSVLLLQFLHKRSTSMQKKPLVSHGLVLAQS